MMVVAESYDSISDSAALHIGIVFMAGWGCIAILLSLIVLKNFGGATDWAVRRMGQDKQMDDEDREGRIKTYRFFAKAFFCIGVAVIIYALTGLLR
jgi:hypothetical protein